MHPGRTPETDEKGTRGGRRGGGVRGGKGVVGWEVVSTGPVIGVSPESSDCFKCPVKGEGGAERPAH